MAIGGFGGALANLGAITQGEQQYENQDQAIAYRRALLQKAAFDMAQARRQQVLQQQQAQAQLGYLSDPQQAALFQQQQGSPFGGGPMQGVGQPVGGPLPGGPGAGTQPQPQPMGQPQAGRGSWFGSTPGWPDAMSGPNTASGTPLSTPGIALPSRSTLGQNFDVTSPAGQTMTLPQTDIGPAARTGRGIDINSAAAAKMGYTPQTFPTDQQFTWQLSPQQQAQARAGAQSTVRAIPQQAWGRVDPFQLAQVIEKINPGADDEVKMGILANMYHVMSASGKEQFQQWIEAAKLGEEKTRTGIEQQRADTAAAQGSERLGIERASEESAATRRGQEAEEAKARITEEHARTTLMQETAPARLKMATEKAAAPVKARIDEDRSLAADAESLLKMVEENPKLVAGPGWLTRTTQGLAETYLGRPEDPDVAAFPSRMQTLQARLQKQLLGSRYYSRASQDRMSAIVPGIGKLDNPSKVKSALQDIVWTLNEEADISERSMGESTSGIGSQYQSLSDEDLKRTLGLQ